jgi:glutaredoxin
MLVKALRNGLGLLIVGIDKLTRPKATSRSVEQQNQAQNAVKGLSLYQLYACPFCVKTRRAIHLLNVDIELRDIGKDPEHRQTLQEEGGKVMSPCLRIEEGGDVRWLYQSNDIIAFLQQRVATL